VTSISRRQLLGGAAKITAAGGAIALSGGSILSACSESSGAATNDVVPFTGEHQAGIVTPAPGRLVYVAFDVTSNRHTEVRDLLQRWSTAIAAMTAGRAVGSIAPTNVLEAPGDTGEAVGNPAARLTVTVGFGRSLFVDDEGEDRFGISDKLPKQLEPLPRFAGDELDPTRSGGDISIQCCADDPQVAFHAFHNLARIARGVATVRWVQLGFGRTSATTNEQSTPRNLMGFKDGTNNIKAEETQVLTDEVWVGTPDRPAWLHGGSFVVVRRIRMLLEAWDRTSLQEQQDTIGRTKLEGAPLGGTKEHDVPDLAHLPDDAHIRLAAPAENKGIRILRRGFSFADGVDPATGQLDAGLFFIAYQRDPRRQFVPLQKNLADNDALNEYIKHVGSAVFAVPPGVQSGGYVGQTLFG
jgi:deferrochelatase/peroxidase EfeB